MKESDVSSTRIFFDLYFKEIYHQSADKFNVASNLRMKYFHSLAVHTLTRRLAKELHLDNQATLRIRAAALLHDIGRFPQIVDRRTYEDTKSADHADLGVKIIREEGVIGHLGAEDLEAIEAAIRYHNKLSLPPSLMGQTRVVAEVLRDADKIDIIRIAVEFFTSEIEGCKTGWFTDISFAPICNPILVIALLAGKTLPIAEISTVYDEFLLYLSWVNDFHYDISVRYLDKLGSIKYMMSMLPDDTLRDDVSKYINEIIKKRCDCIG